ncbi:MAG: hypothetical protein HWD61_08915 [Parachlamydiaceae bacterium]|nr:MAG: hypothetical protein HWD61_08915 [Parachlamydiaceae bacterium]
MLCTNFFRFLFASSYRPPKIAMGITTPRKTTGSARSEIGKKTAMTMLAVIPAPNPTEVKTAGIISFS